MLDIMVDLETLGQVPGCSILSIGAVPFDPQAGLIKKDFGFYQVVNRASCISHGLHEDPRTIEWWTKQSPEAAEVVRQATSGQFMDLGDALSEFTKFLRNVGSKRSIRVWGNGADFDNAILAVCYSKIGVGTPWEFWNNRCYRTLKNMYPMARLEKRTGTYHNALDDAVTQAEHAIELFHHHNGT